MGINTPEFRISFPAILEPKLNDLSDKMEYSCVALFPKGADLSAMKAEAQRVAVEKWGDKIPANLRSPFREQGEKDYEGYVAGATFVRLKSQTRPGIVDLAVAAIIDPSKVYAGVWAIAHTNAYAYHHPKGGPGVAFGLEHLQIVRDDEPLDGRQKVESVFKPVAGAVAATEGKPAASLFG
jgi:hypothetical protein